MSYQDIHVDLIAFPLPAIQGLFSSYYDIIFYLLPNEHQL